jgi:hypothetical protein
MYFLTVSLFRLGARLLLDYEKDRLLKIERYKAVSGEIKAF